MCTVIWDIWGERNDQIFRGKGEHSEIWSFVRFLVSLWAFILKDFCNYSMGNILLSQSPSFCRVVLVTCFLYAFIFFHFFPMKIVDFTKKNHKGNGRAG